MALKDYQDMVNRLQKGLAEAYAADPLVLNVPGRSAACKVDPSYYLALVPAFEELLARAAAMLPSDAAEALVRTGNVITSGPERKRDLAVRVTFGGRVYEMRACFVDADFVDRALKLHAGVASVPPVADLRILAECRTELERFFENKTQLSKAAFAD